MVRGVVFMMTGIGWRFGGGWASLGLRLPAGDEKTDGVRWMTSLARRYLRPVLPWVGIALVFSSAQTGPELGWWSSCPGLSSSTFDPGR